MKDKNIPLKLVNFEWTDNHGYKHYDCQFVAKNASSYVIDQRIRETILSRLIRGYKVLGHKNESQRSY